MGDVYVCVNKSKRSYKDLSVILEMFCHEDKNGFSNKTWLFIVPQCIIRLICVVTLTVLAVSVR